VKCQLNTTELNYTSFKISYFLSPPPFSSLFLLFIYSSLFIPFPFSLPFPFFRSFRSSFSLISRSSLFYSWLSVLTSSQVRCYPRQTQCACSHSQKYNRHKTDSNSDRRLEHPEFRPFVRHSCLVKIQCHEMIQDCLLPIPLPFTAHKHSHSSRMLNQTVVLDNTKYST
jgi:hypothetical protein